MRRAIIRPQAELDLLQIWHYVARDRPAAASRLLDDLQAAIETLRERPTLGRPRGEVGDDRYLFHRVGNYLVAYRIADAAVVIERVLHGARDLREVSFL